MAGLGGPMKVQCLDVAGVSTRVLSAGTGRPVLLLHGIGLTADIWVPTVRRLSLNHQVWAPDLLWHGHTRAPRLRRGAAPHPQIVSHLTALLDTLDLEGVTLVGSSFGGLVAALTYLDRPERIHRLVIVGSGSCFDSDAALQRMLQQSYNNAMRTMRAGTVEAWAARLERICFQSRSVPTELLLPMATAFSLPGAVEDFERFMSARLDMKLEGQHRILNRLDEFALPVRVIWGRNEVRGEEASARQAVGLMPDAKMTVYERCGHLPFLERRCTFTQEVTDFIADGNPSRLLSVSTTPLGERI